VVLPFPKVPKHRHVPMTTQNDSHWFSVGIILAGCVLVVAVLSRPEKPVPQTTQQQEPQTWNPVEAVRTRYPDSGLTDEQIFQNLHDPVKFRLALPDYSIATDHEIKSGDFQAIYQSAQRNKQRVKIDEAQAQLDNLKKAIDEVHCEGFFDAPIGFKKCPALDELKAAKELQQKYVDSLKEMP
jgi:hypothetical protein